MKKTLFLGLIAAALGFTACSSEDDAILGNNTQKKGMVLNATVEQPAETRATIDNSAANWQFAFAQDDVIKVTNSAVTSGTYYTFTNDGTNFKSTDAESTATAANWFAYFPSNTINLTNQAGTMDGVANLYALAGTTASATTGADGLTIPMSAKVAILKIENYKGSIDIQVKTSDTDYVKGLTAKNGEAGFEVSTLTTATNLFTTSETGTYYVAVPAGVQLSVKDGSTTIKSTGTNGLTAGKYYNLTVEPVNPLLPGSFSVSATKTVKFTKSNLYWSNTDNKFHFEAKPTDYLETRNQDHVCHFFWTKDKDKSYAAIYGDGTNATSDKFFADGSDAGHKLTVDGVSGLYILSEDEWNYLLNSRDDASTKQQPGVTVTDGENSYTCLIIAPDDFTGTIATSYTLEELETAGLVCLPAAGCFYQSNGNYDGDGGYYWSSTPYALNEGYAHFLYFDSEEYLIEYPNGRGNGYSLRAVRAE